MGAEDLGVSLEADDNLDVLNDEGTEDNEVSDNEVSDDKSDNEDSDDKESDESEDEDENLEDTDDEDSDDKEDDEDTDEEKSDKEGQEKEEPKELKLAFSDIKKKYPEFFKDFPQFRGIVAQHRQYQEVFSTIEEAQEANATVENYNRLAETVFSGNTETFLTDVASANKEGFSKFVNNFLPAVFNADEKTYFKITTPIVEGVFRSLYAEGKGHNDKNAANSAIIAYAKTFGVNFEKAEEALSKAPEKKETKKSPEQEAFEREQRDFYREKYSTLNTRINNDIKSVIDAEFMRGVEGLSKLEGKAFMSECYRLLSEEVGKDKAHQNRIGILWNKEEKAGFTGVNADSIKNVVLSRAKASIPTIRAKVKAEMGKGKSTKEDKTKGRNRHVPSGGGNKGGGKITSRTNPRAIDYSKTSDIDILTDGVGGNVKMRA